MRIHVLPILATMVLGVLLLSGVVLAKDKHCYNNCKGTDRGEQISGDGSKNKIWGLGGRDYVYGNGAGDTLFGGTGNDEVHGGSGKDYIKGGSGCDRLWGKIGVDKLVDESGGCNGAKSHKDELLGGSGSDTIRAQDGKKDIISGGPGRDTAYADPVDTFKGVEKKVVPKQCKDGIDNDGDGKTDLQDPGCASATDDTENSTTIAPQNPPVAQDDSYSIPSCSGIKEGVLNVDAPGVLGNDTDADGDTLSAVLVGTGPTHGTLTLNNNGSFKYVADCEIDQADSFTYKATDGAADSKVATVSLTVP